MSSEYRDYMLTWQGKRPWVPCRSYNPAAARHEFWQYYQNVVMSDLYELAKEGWSPLVTDLPSGVQLRDYKALRFEAFGWVMFVIFIFASWGLGLLFVPFLFNSYYEPTGYNIQLIRG
jgi:hypothetical protein